MPPKFKVPPYHIAYPGLHDQGRGMIATALIPAGTRILTERPLITQNITFMTITPSEAQELAMAAQINALPPLTQQNYRALTNQHPFASVPIFNGRGQDTGKKLYVKVPDSGRFRANAIPLSTNPENQRGNEVGVYLCLSKINHACLPNAQQTWNPTAQTCTLHALKAIPAGAQITISYAASLRLDPVYIKRTFNFTCACTLCQIPNSKAKQRRCKSHWKIERLGNEMLTKTVQAEALGVAKKVLALMDAMQVHDWRRGMLFADAVDIMAEGGDVERTVVFAEAAREAWMRCEGGDSSNITVLGDKLVELFGKPGMTGEEALRQMAKGDGKEGKGWDVVKKRLVDDVPRVEVVDMGGMRYADVVDWLFMCDPLVEEGQGDGGVGVVTGHVQSEGGAWVMI